jgi:DNA-binding SARP family transcriptional activator/WD40 repeat protein
MAGLQIQLLGTIGVKLNGQEIVTFKLQKERALLAYLAVESNRPQRREHLAELFWPGYPEASALSSLRFALSDLRKAIGDSDANPPYLLVTRDNLQLNPASDAWVDVTVFEQAELEGTRSASSALLQFSLDLYQGEFLEGFSLADCPAFEQWLLGRREQLHRRALKMLSVLAEAHEHEGRLADALRCAYRQVALEPSHEPGQRQLMRLLALDGQRSAALAQYEACQKAMAEELGVEPSDETKQLYEAIRGESLAPAARMAIEGQAPTAELPPAPGEPPFKGLQFFDVGDAGLFFGREGLIKQLVGQVWEMVATRGDGVEAGGCCFLAVVGASGSGKSSLVRAGLVAALQKPQAMPEDSSQWPVHVITPTAHPLEALALSLTRGSESVTAAATLIDDLGKDGRSLHLYVNRLLSQAGSDDRRPKYLLLVIDQLEELFTLCRSEEEGTAFINNLLAALHGPALVVVTLRADFYAHCARYPGLRQALCTRQEYIGPMTAEELRRAIEEPAQQGGWEFEPGLVDLILRDVGDEPGALPLLEHALLETWQRRSGRTMTLKGYAAAGGVQGAIAHTADAVYARLDPEQQEQARRIFLRLTELGEGTQDTRRRAPLSELVPDTQEGQAVESLLKTLADARLVTLSEDTAEVAHEALIREWPALRSWLSEDRESLRLHRRLTEAAQEWEKLGRDNDELYRGARLAQALEWASQSGHAQEMNTLEKAFLAGSQEMAESEAREHAAQQQRELEAAQKLAESERKNAEDQKQTARRLRRRAYYLAGAAGLALVLMVAAFLIAVSANHNARMATAREYKSAALAGLGTDPIQSIVLALMSIQIEPSEDAYSALHQAMFATHLRSRLLAHSGWVYGMSVNPAGDRLATIGTDRTLKVWRLNGASVVQPPLLTVPDIGQAADERVTYLGQNLAQFTPDSQYLAVVDHLDEIILVNSTSGSVESRVDLSALGNVAVLNLAISPVIDGTGIYRLAAMVRFVDRSLRSYAVIVELGSGHGQIIDSQFVHGGDFTTFAFRQDGSLITGGYDAYYKGEIKLWDLPTQSNPAFASFKSEWNVTRLVDVPGEPVYHLSLSPDGSRLVYSTSTLLSYSDHILDISPLASGAPPVEKLTIAPEPGLSPWATAMFFLPGGEQLARFYVGGRAIIYDAKTGQKVFMLSEPVTDMIALAFSDVNPTLFSGNYSGEIYSWDVSAPRSPEWVSVPTIGVSAGVVLNPNGVDLLAWNLTGANSGKVKFTNFRLDGQQALRLGNFTVDTGASAPFFYFGPTRLALGDQSNIGVHSTLTGDRIQDFRNETDLSDFLLSPDGSRIYFAQSYGVLETWSVDSGQRLSFFKITPRPAIVQKFLLDLSRDGTLLLTWGLEGSRDPVIRLWDAASGKAVREFTEANGAICSPALTPDNRFLVTCEQNHSAQVWEVASGKQVRNFTLTSDPTLLQVSPDGRYLVASLPSSQTVVFDFNTGRELVVLPGSSTWVLNYPKAMGYQFSPDSRYILITFPGDQMTYGFILDNDELVKLACQRVAAITLPEENGVFQQLPICQENGVTGP